MAQQYYTITEDGIYGQRQYYTGDQIPMEWAVAWGLDGAALEAGEFFSSEERAAIAGIIADAMNPGIEPNNRRLFLNPIAYPTANAAWFFRFRVPAPRTLASIAYYVGTASGNVDLGVYTSVDGGTTLTRLGSTGSTAAAGASTTQTIDLTAPVELSPGTDYWLAIAADNTTLTTQWAGVQQPTMLLGNEGFVKGSSFPLPASVTDLAGANAVFFLYGA